ncbi:hypothetical protein BKK79_33310 [Cupriavidus sp. USMAA2-4]|nr:hypothetical protein BKK79_33310 [Cupriavidus sp. USMAA2-4]
MPPDRPHQAERQAIGDPRRQDPRQLAHAIPSETSQVANIVLSVVVFTAMFTACTYLADMLERVAGVAPAHVGWG